VVATLTEDDRVPISPLPGETSECKDYLLRIGDDALMEFVDTPGFQNPKAVLEWLQSHGGDPASAIAAFRAAHQNQPRFHHDCELLKPLEERAGVLFVVDGSRPLRPADEMEMEVLRLTGLPRMAIINCKRQGRDFSSDWQQACARHFNSIRRFDAHRSSFADRIALFEALMTLDQDWQPLIGEVVERLRRQWQSRLNHIAFEIEQMLTDCLLHERREARNERLPRDVQQAQALEKYQAEVAEIERRMQERIRDLLRHRRISIATTPVGLVAENLFSDEVWQTLGLTRQQFATACGVLGASMGAGVDLVLGGLSFGVFTGLGAAAGGAFGWLGGPGLGQRKLKLPGFLGDLSLGGRELRVGLRQNPQLTFVLLDRALLFARQLLAWTHARRDPEAFAQQLQSDTSLSREWDEADRSIVMNWQKALDSSGPRREKAAEALHAVLVRQLSA
jgi:hypothetical protein